MTGPRPSAAISRISVAVCQCARRCSVAGRAAIYSPGLAQRRQRRAAWQGNRIIEWSRPVGGQRLLRSARARALAVSRACSLSSWSGRMRGPRHVVPIKEHRGTSVREPDLEAAGIRHGFMPDDADAVGHSACLGFCLGLCVPDHGLGRRLILLRSSAPVIPWGGKIVSNINEINDVRLICSGALGEIRTPDPRNRNPILAP